MAVRGEREGLGGSEMGLGRLRACEAYGAGRAGGGAGGGLESTSIAGGVVVLVGVRDGDGRVSGWACGGVGKKSCGPWPACKVVVRQQLRRLVSELARGRRP